VHLHILVLTTVLVIECTLSTEVIYKVFRIYIRHFFVSVNLSILAPVYTAHMTKPRVPIASGNVYFRY